MATKAREITLLDHSLAMDPANGRWHALVVEGANWESPGSGGQGDVYIVGETLCGLMRLRGLKRHNYIPMIGCPDCVRLLTKIAAERGINPDQLFRTH